MNTRQIQYVLTVAETHSFSEAAKKLMISQPSLSQYIAKIEEEIGLQLFERSVPLKLTYAGEIYMNTAKKILIEEDKFKDQMDELKGGLSGKLKIGAGYISSVSIVPKLIAKFLEELPNVEIEVIEKTEPKLKNMLDDGDLDLLIATSRFDSSTYEKVMLGQEKYLIAVPKAFGDCGKEDDSSQTPSELSEIDVLKLKDVPVIRLKQNTYMRELIDNLYEINHVQIKSTVECTSALAAYNMTKAGVGASIISYGLYELNNSPDVNYYEVRELKKQRQIFFVYNKSKYLNRLSREFIEVGQKYFSKSIKLH